MEEELEIIDVSEKKKDYFLIFVIASLVILVVGFILIYFFGYNILKPFIEV